MKVAIASIRLLAAVAVLGAIPGALFAQAPKSRGSAILPGGNSKQPISIQATKLDYFDKEQKLIYTGNVVAAQGDSKLKCSVLTIYLPPKTDGGSTGAAANQVRRMEAAGPVTMVSKDQVGTGDNGVYDKNADTVVLTGNVTLTQGPNVTQGDKLEYNLRSGQAKVTGGHVISMIQPGNSDEPSSRKANPGRSTRPEASEQ